MITENIYKITIGIRFFVLYSSVPYFQYCSKSMITVCYFSTLNDPIFYFKKQMMYKEPLYEMK